VCAGEKEILTQAAELLAIEFPAMFSVSINCRLPHVNVDNLRSGPGLTGADVR
jgi:hypothetical protein